MLVGRKPRTQLVDGIERTGADMVKGTPVKGHKGSRLRPLEERQCIGRGEVSTAKSRFPPRRVPNGKQRDVELSAIAGEMIVDHLVRPIRERCVPREENRTMAGC